MMAASARLLCDLYRAPQIKNITLFVSCHGSIESWKHRVLIGNAPQPRICRSRGAMGEVFFSSGSAVLHRVRMFLVHFRDEGLVVHELQRVGLFVIQAWLV